MDERSARSAAKSARSAVTANALARSWLLELCGERRWNDSRERQIERGARKASMSPRRARAIINGEQHVRVSGDELLAIKRARDDLAALSALARNADALASAQAAQASHQALRERAEAIRAESAALIDALKDL